MNKKVSRRQFIGASVGATAALVAAEGAPAVAERPNVLFILADDLGYGDLSCYGRPDYRTPVLDKLAQQGIRFTSAYAAAPVCTPTRCSFITGRYPQRLHVGLREPLTDPTDDIGLPLWPPDGGVSAQRQRLRHGACWQMALGWKPEFRPNRHGYREFFGTLSGPPTTSPTAPKTSTARTFGRISLRSARGVFDRPALRQSGRVRDPSPKSAVLLEPSIHRAPFPVGRSRGCGHRPRAWPWAHGRGRIARIYGSMVRSMDKGIGRVLTALDRAGLARRTLVIFTSDNGGERYSFNWPFSFEKMYLWEGGIRVPAIVRWPGVIRPGQTTEQAAITMDWARTILAATSTAAGSQLSPRWRESPAGLHRNETLRSRAVLAHSRAGRSTGGAVEVPPGIGRRASVRPADRPG